MLVGGKVKPLKAAKKQAKELDEDDLAHREKMKAGRASQRIDFSSYISSQG
jgi:hypothetical protein